MPQPSDRPALTRAQVLAAAVRLTDEHGLGALTMRRLGAELGVEAMSLYHHVPGKAALLAGVADAVAAELALPDPGLPWDARLHALVTGYRAVAHRHPPAFRLLVEGHGARVEVLVDAFVEALADSGRPPDVRDAAFAALVAFAEGFVLSEISGTFSGTPAGDPGRADELFERALGLLLDGLRAVPAG